MGSSRWRKHALALTTFALVVLLLVVNASEDDTWEAWEEWGESKESKEAAANRRPRQNPYNLQRGRKINVDALMGSIPKKMELFFADGTFRDFEQCKTLASKWNEQMRLGGVEATISCIDEKGSLVGRAESKRDAHNARTFLLKREQIHNMRIDNQDFKKPTEDDADDEYNDEL